MPTCIASLLLEDFEVILHQPQDHFFRFHLGELEIAVAVPFGQQSFLKKRRNVVEQVVVPGVPDEKVALPVERWASRLQVVQFVLQVTGMRNENPCRGSGCIRR